MPIVSGDYPYPVRITEQSAWYASAEGGRVAFNASTDLLTVPSGGENVPLAAFVNPTDSGYDVYLDVGEFAASQNTTFRRLRGTTLSDLGTSKISINRGGGETTAVASIYPAGEFAMSNGTTAKTAHIAAYQQYLTKIGGSVILRPGQNICWTVEAKGGTASVYLEWWELPAKE